MKDTTGTSTSVYGEMAYWMPDYNASTGNNSIHPKYIKGNSNGWIKSSYCWYWVLPVTKKAENIISSPTIMPPDTVLIRFKFVSNNNSNSNEGWMIDDIILDVAYPGSCSNIEQIEKQYISVFPNPTQNVIYLQNIPEIQNACVEVTDITGKIHFSENYRYLNSQTLVILKNIDNDGMYFLNIYCDNNILRSKIIIQK
ncbi:MAG: hypothetical protein KatS3mg028_0292 [Bacteroidia bacterium]|nr:MAG: hypothetical protein KatS3mg028_0292 [Bacteroidia bacterium]